MKKLIFTILAGASLIFAQGGTHDKGQLNIYADLALNSGANVYAGYASSLMLGPAVSVVYGIHKDVSIGGMVMTTFGSHKTSYAHNGFVHEYKHSSFNMAIGARAAYHFGSLLKMPSNLDWYAGASLGPLIYHSKFKETTDFDNTYEVNNGYYSGTGASFYFAALTGFKWNFSETIGLHTEIGGGINSLYWQIGVGFQM